MNEFQAAMGLCVLDDMEIIVRERKRIWDAYTDAFKNSGTIELQKQNALSSQNYSYYPIVLKSEEILLQVKEALLEKEIAPRRYFYPSLEQVYYIKPGQLVPHSASIAQRILCLPIYPNLELEVQKTIIDTVIKTPSIYG
jgi:dTDP-4-amino-4,6-dideoxygalactose transaminase